MIYLASPYSHPDPEVRQARYEAACRATVWLMQHKRCPVFSAIVHTHPLTRYGLPTDWEFWERFDRGFLERADQLVVLCIDGWSQSRGVRAEMRIARQLGKPIGFLSRAVAEKGADRFFVARKGG